MNLKGKTIFISGASRGIGLAIVKTAAADGANVAIAAKTTDPNPKLPGTIFTAAEDIEKAGGKALPLPCDIRDEQSVEKAVADTVAKFGGIDILVNNAGIFVGKGVEEASMDEWHRLVAVNLTGVVLGTKIALPHLKEATA